MSTFPKSPKEAVGGLTYFPRMLDKIRRKASGELGPEYQKNLGKPLSGDGALTNFLRVDYANLCERVLQGGTDEEILEWCFEKGRRLNEGDIRIWNGFITRLGWRDFAAARLEQGKKEHGIADRADIATMGDLIDYEEGRLI